MAKVEVPGLGDDAVNKNLLFFYYIAKNYLIKRTSENPTQ